MRISSTFESAIHAASKAMFLLVTGVATVLAAARAAPSAPMPADAKTLQTTASFHLPTPEGVRDERERLRAIALHLCTDAAQHLELSPEGKVSPCVDETLAVALRTLKGPVSLNHANAILPRDSVSPAHPAGKVDPDRPAMTVSLADLDLSTPEGARTAHERLRKAARRLCSRLADELDLGRQPHFVACVDQATNDAQRQLIARQLAARTVH